MSELLKTLADHIRSHPEIEVRAAIGHSGLGDSQDDPSDLREADHDLEGRKIDPVAVGEPEFGPLRFFCDGIQRVCGPVYIGEPAPIVYGYTAAAIRERGPDKMMRITDGARRAEEGLYWAFGRLDPSVLGPASRWANDSGDDEKTDHPLKLAEKAKKKISLRRETLESELVRDWLRDRNGSDHWLVVDGSLISDYEDYDSPNVIGIVKSHQTQYFPWAEQCRILDMKAGERSGVFVPKGRKRPEVYSWYLRMHPTEGRDVYFGLVRVEAAKSDRTLDMADEISRWLLAERCPLSLPDSRWDRMIYPIYDCEQYLKSLAPSRDTLDALLASLTAARRNGTGE